MTDVSKTQTDQREVRDDERHATRTEAGAGETTFESPDRTRAREPGAVAGPHASTPVRDQMDSSAMDHQSTLVKEVSTLRNRWESVQVGFVDDPRRAVSDAEALVGEVINDMTAGFRDQRHQLDSLWSNGQEVSTEQLRQAIQRYRDFFERFLRV